jgi:hypothetical protein
MAIFDDGMSESQNEDEQERGITIVGDSFDVMLDAARRQAFKNMGIPPEFVYSNHTPTAGDEQAINNIAARNASASRAAYDLHHHQKVAQLLMQSGHGVRILHIPPALGLSYSNIPRDDSLLVRAVPLEDGSLWVSDGFHVERAGKLINTTEYHHPVHGIGRLVPRDIILYDEPARYPESYTKHSVNGKYARRTSDDYRGATVNKIKCRAKRAAKKAARKAQRNR